jgi:TolB protein
MASQFGQDVPPRPARSRRHGVGWTFRITPAGVILLIVINLAILGGWAYGLNRLMQRFNTPASVISPTATNIILAAATNTLHPPTRTPTNQPSINAVTQHPDISTTEPPTSSPQPISTMNLDQGLLILSLDEGGNDHLFAYQPEASGAGQPLPLTRLTYGPWNDISPAISPDGQSVAFASNRNGYWDIYLLNLASGGVTRLTDTLGYEAYPSWSPDGNWLVYEAYIDNNLEIVIQSVSSPGDMIRLTSDPSADFSPDWSPQGRKIAFVSNRSGDDEIWLADLDKGEEERFQNISQDSSTKDTHPAWSPDGSEIVWSSEQQGMHHLIVQHLDANNEPSQTPLAAERKDLGSGDWPVWSEDGATILAILEAPNHISLTAYPVSYAGVALPDMELPGEAYGLSWRNNPLAPSLQTIYQQAAQATPTPLFIPSVTSVPGNTGERYQLSPLDGVEAPHAYLHDLIDESFLSLRARITVEAGWDFLSKLENAYVPLASPLSPGMGNDWLYTGRAFAIDTLPMNAGWMVVVREDFGADTYWRIYLRALYQDGSAGIPLHDQPWNFDGRFSEDTTLYEQGGVLQASIPPGYWIDFTEKAHSYGWYRLPALVTWRAYYPAARFNEFAATGGLNWQTAMLELYPPEVLVTPTAVVPPTRTPTPTLRWYVSPTPTKTPTFRPTFTPSIITPAGTPIPGG